MSTLTGPALIAHEARLLAEQSALDWKMTSAPFSAM